MVKLQGRQYDDVRARTCRRTRRHNRRGDDTRYDDAMRRYVGILLVCCNVPRYAYRIDTCMHNTATAGSVESLLSFDDHHVQVTDRPHFRYCSSR